MNLSGLWKDEEKENLILKQIKISQASDTKTTKHDKIMISGVILSGISLLVNFSSDLCVYVIFKSHLFITFTHPQAPDCQHSEQIITHSFFHDIPHPTHHPHREKYFPNISSKPILCQWEAIPSCPVTPGSFPKTLSIFLVSPFQDLEGHN